jgi:hypothetical protein
MRRFVVTILLIIAAAFLLSACSEQTDTTSPLAQDADMEKAPTQTTDNMLLLLLERRMARMNEGDWLPIVIPIGAGQRFAASDPKSLPIMRDMPPITIEFDNDALPMTESTITIWVPVLAPGQDLILPGNCIPFKYRSSLPATVMQSLAMNFPYSYFNSQPVLTDRYRTFGIENDADGQPYAVHAKHFINEDFDPMGTIGFTASIEFWPGQPGTPPDVVEGYVDPDYEGEDEYHDY